MVGKAEAGKDLIETVAESTAGAVNRITSIITKAVIDVGREIGGVATDVFEMREAAQKASEDDER